MENIFLRNYSRNQICTFPPVYAQRVPAYLQHIRLMNEQPTVNYVRFAKSAGKLLFHPITLLEQITNVGRGILPIYLFKLSCWLSGKSISIPPHLNHRSFGVSKISSCRMSNFQAGLKRFLVFSHILIEGCLHLL